MTSAGGSKEVFEDAHEFLANTLIVFAALHVAGVVLHALRHRDGIALSMVTGEKQPVEGHDGIYRSHRAVALLFVALVGAFVFYLGKNYDGTNQKLSLFGNTLTLRDLDHDDDHDDDD